MSEEFQAAREISISDCDARGRIRPSSLLVLMQEIGETHAATLGLSRTRLVQNGMCWVLYRQRTVMARLPHFHEKIRATTWPAPVEGPLFPRCFLFEAEDGRPLGSAVAAWVLMDIQTRRPLRPSALVGDLPPSLRPSPLPIPAMLRVTGGESLGSRKVCYSDVDVNGHMNNTRYIDWVCDALNYGALEEKGLAEWQVNYLAEARPGEKIALSSLEDGEATLFSGKREADGRAIFEARVILGR